MTQKEIGAYLKKVREKKGITLYQIHRKDKVLSLMTVKTIEEGKGGQIDTLLKYCEYLGVRITLELPVVLCE